MRLGAAELQEQHWTPEQLDWAASTTCPYLSLDMALPMAWQSKGGSDAVPTQCIFSYVRSKMYGKKIWQGLFCCPAPNSPTSRAHSAHWNVQKEGQVQLQKRTKQLHCMCLRHVVGVVSGMAQMYPCMTSYVTSTTEDCLFRLHRIGQQLLDQVLQLVKFNILCLIQQSSELGLCCLVISRRVTAKQKKLSSVLARAPLGQYSLEDSRMYWPVGVAEPTSPTTSPPAGQQQMHILQWRHALRRPNQQT